MKVGIITEYCKSKNYGGNLQAYALCKYLNSIDGVIAEQIQYRNTSQNKIKANIKGVIMSYLMRLNPADKYIAKKLEQRAQVIYKFNQKIPHSEKIYTDDDISDCVKKYDAFITGSDQVWNLSYNKPAYLLKFVPSDKPKISYAASLGCTELSENEKYIFKEALSGYLGISVRERESIELLQPLSSIPVEWAVDPVLLLGKEDWYAACDDFVANKKYLFCYFLGADDNARMIANQYAKEHKLKIVTLPHLFGGRRSCDMRFGDERLYDVSPERLLSLIKNAECVFTDSFHASVFSILFEKNFITFERSGKKGMNSRISSLMYMFEFEERFCDKPQKATLEYINSLPRMDYDRPFPIFDESKKNSCDFLTRTIDEMKELFEQEVKK